MTDFARKLRAERMLEAERMLRAGQFVDVDKLLSASPLPEDETEVLVAIASITFHGRDQLTERGPFIERLRALLEDRHGIDRAAELLTFRDEEWETLRKIIDPDGDSIEFDIVDDGVDIAIKQGPREVCRLGLTSVQLDVLIDRLARIRQLMKQKDEGES